MIKNDNKSEARKMADIILNEPTVDQERRAETIQGLLGYVSDIRDCHPATASLVEEMLQHIFEALEPDQVIP